jgi:hypothetical protein
MGASRNLLGQRAAGHFHHGQQFGPLGRPQALDGLQRFGRGLQQAGESAVPQHLRGQSHHAVAFVAGAQQQGQQLGVGQGGGTAGQQLFARALVGRQVFHR